MPSSNEPKHSFDNALWYGDGGGECVSFHWVALSNFHWLMAADSRKENRSLHLDKSQACMKSLGSTQKHFFLVHLEVSSTEEEWIWIYPQVLQASYCLTHWHTSLHNRTDPCLDCYSTAAMYTILSIAENALWYRKTSYIFITSFWICNSQINSSGHRLMRAVRDPNHRHWTWETSILE